MERLARNMNFLFVFVLTCYQFLRVFVLHGFCLFALYHDSLLVDLPGHENMPPRSRVTTRVKGRSLGSGGSRFSGRRAPSCENFQTSEECCGFATTVLLSSGLKESADLRVRNPRTRWQ